MTVTIGDHAPDFELPNQFGQRVRLSNFAGERPVVLVFFPLAFSGVCTDELTELARNRNVFDQHRAALLAVSVDSVASLRAFSEAGGFEFDVLADFWPHGAVAERYGVFLPDHGYAGRSTFVIDSAGVIRSVFSSEPGRARSFEDYGAALESLG
jgi:peroxiredoxin